MSPRSTYDAAGLRAGVPSTGDSAVELIPDKLYALGDVELLDGRISWVPADWHGYQSINCYLLLEGKQALLVESGVPRHRSTILKQLKSLLPAEYSLSIYVTRIELDCCGNVGAISEAFSVSKLYYGGAVASPFQPIEFVAYAPRTDPHDAAVSDKKFVVEYTPKGQSIPLGAHRRLEVVPPGIRLLATAWGYDTGTGALFSSDTFGHVTLSERNASRIIDTPADVGTLEDIGKYLYTKFEWLLDADTSITLRNLDSVFEQRQVQIIAPTHGCILRGRDTVKASYEALRALLLVRAGSETA
jgi:flavorubredoxin